MALAMMFLLKEALESKTEDTLQSEALEELRRYGQKHKEWKRLEKLFETSKEPLLAAVKAYTSEAVYRQIGSDLVNGTYHNISAYLSTIFLAQNSIGPELVYSKQKSALYRGVKKEFINL